MKEKLNSLLSQVVFINNFLSLSVTSLIKLKRNLHLFLVINKKTKNSLGTYVSNFFTMQTILQCIMIEMLFFNCKMLHEVEV